MLSLRKLPKFGMVSFELREKRSRSKGYVGSGIRKRRSAAENDGQSMGTPNSHSRPSASRITGKSKASSSSGRRIEGIHLSSVLFLSFSASDAFDAVCRARFVSV